MQKHAQSTSINIKFKYRKNYHPGNMHGEHKSKKSESDCDEVKSQPVSFLDVGVVSAACTFHLHNLQ